MISAVLAELISCHPRLCACTKRWACENIEGSEGKPRLYRFCSRTLEVILT